ncbi:tyrosine-type recombinase/integrase [Candidatus Falkowbacteria bacterium]|nr:tyrosine-type recombinase/integrase [Candidatus Falkowbacteria bacterium]
MVNHEIINQFLIWLRAGHSGATVSSYFWALRQFEIWLDLRKKEILKMTMPDFPEYHLWLENRGLHSGTRYSYLGTVRTLWRWLYQQQRVNFPETLIPLPNRNDVKSHECLFPDEFLKMISCFDELFPKDLRDKTAISLLFATGLRLGELLSLNVSDMNLEMKTAEVKTFKRKNHKRQIFWDDATNCLLAKWIELRQRLLDHKNMESIALFIALDSNKFGDRLFHHAVQKTFRRIRAKCGIDKKITPHSCRHGFATLGVKNNIKLMYLKEMMGHASIRSTQIYTHLENKDIELEYRKIYSVVNHQQSQLFKNNR